MALAIFKGLSDFLKYHQLTEIKVNLIPPESQQSKLKSKDDLPSQSYQVQAELELNLSAIERLKKRAGRFVLATNDLEKKGLSSEDILKKYREHLTYAMSINTYSSQKLENLQLDHKEK